MGIFLGSLFQDFRDLCFGILIKDLCFGIHIWVQDFRYCILGF